MDCEDDPLQWELDQLEKLDKLADKYGWTEIGKDYQARVKLIQAQSMGRQKALVRRAPAAAVAASGRAAVMAAVPGCRVQCRSETHARRLG